MKRLFLAITVVSLAVALTPVSALAARQPSPAAKPVTHDMSHPVKVNYPCPGMSHSGVGPTDVFNCATTATTVTQGLSPNANSPASMCVNNVAYIQSYPAGGATRWYASNAGSAGTDVDSWVEYYWCATKPGTSQYSSINWAYGHEYPRQYCEHLYAGKGGTYHNPWFVREYGLTGFYYVNNAGAALTSLNGFDIDDGEFIMTWLVTAFLQGLQDISGTIRYQLMGPSIGNPTCMVMMLSLATTIPTSASLNTTLMQTGVGRTFSSSFLSNQLLIGSDNLAP